MGIVGSSLLASVLAARLAQNHRVEIFEHRTLGGAWGQSQLGDTLAPRHSNVIVPSPGLDSSVLPAAFRWLSSRGADVEWRSELLPLERNTLVEADCIVGNFFPAIETLLAHPNISVLETSLPAITNMSGGVGSVGLNALVVTPNSDISILETRVGRLTVAVERNVSLHVRALLKGRVDGPVLREIAKHGDVFDRVGLWARDDSTLFHGRVAREKKTHAAAGHYLDRSSWFSELGAVPLDADLSRYENARWNTPTVEAAQATLANSPIHLLETTDFLKGFVSISKNVSQIEDSFGRYST